MAGYRPLESVCVAYTSSKDDGPTPSALHDEPQCRYYAWTPLWLRWFLDVLVTISLYWTLFSTVPLDLILKLSRRRGPRRDVVSPRSFYLCFVR